MTQTPPPPTKYQANQEPTFVSFVFFDVPTPTSTRFQANQETIFANFRSFRTFSQLKPKETAKRISFSCISPGNRQKKLFVSFVPFDVQKPHLDKVPSEPRTNFRNQPPKETAKRISLSCISPSNRQDKFSSLSCFSMFKKKSFDVKNSTPAKFRAKQETIFA